MSTNNVYRVIFMAELSDNTTGRIAERLGDEFGTPVWAADVEIIPGYSTLESVPNILSMAYSGLTNFDPVYAKNSEGEFILL